MWVLVESGDTVVVPTPAYPIHLVAPALAGARVVHAARRGRRGGGRRGGPRGAAEGRDRLVPAQPDDRRRHGGAMQLLVDLAREREFLLVHDFAYADVAFDGHRPPSVLAAEGAADCAVELYSLTKSFSMAGWRVGFMLGRPDVVAALAKLKSYLDYGTFQPIQIASIVALREARRLPERGLRDLPAAPRRALPRPRARRLARRAAAGDDVRLGADPGAVPRARLAGVRAARSRARRTSRSARASASARAATATCASRSSRTSSGSPRRRVL